jgi:transposase
MGNEEVIMVMDGAGWHKSKELVIPPNFKIIFLPAYSPELNPIERLWLYIKQHTIKNRIYHTLKSLEDVVCDFIRNLEQVQITSICKVHYMFS